MLIKVWTVSLLTLLFVAFITPCSYGGEPVAFTQEDRERLIRLEVIIEEFKESVDKRFEQMMNFLLILAGIFTTLTLGVIGFACWDRRTVIKKARDEAIELVECERLKICERGAARGRVYRTAIPGVNDIHVVTIGGRDENGNDACNDLTDVILEAALNIHTNEPSLGFRYSPDINEKTRRLVYECIAQGYGFPACFHESP